MILFSIKKILYQLKKLIQNFQQIQTNNLIFKLKQYDEELFAACDRELSRQRHNIELIASENIVSKAVLLAAGTVLTNQMRSIEDMESYLESLWGGENILNQPPLSTQRPSVTDPGSRIPSGTIKGNGT